MKSQEVIQSEIGFLRRRSHATRLPTRQATLKAAANTDAIVASRIEGKTIVKTIIIPGKMVNFVVK